MVSVRDADEAGVLSAEELVLLAQRLTMCPDCGDAVIACDNGIRLDTEPDEAGMWGLMNVGGAVWAVSAPEDDEGSRHDLHAHQAEGGVLS